MSYVKIEKEYVQRFRVWAIICITLNSAAAIGGIIFQTYGFGTMIANACSLGILIGFLLKVPHPKG